MLFAAHLCGSLARDAMAGWNSWRGEHDPIACVIQYQRVQLNDFSSFLLPGLRVATCYPSIEFILQCSDGNAIADACELATRYPSVSALYDPSGGRGLMPGRWPTTPPHLRCGFAGGIRHDNVVHVIEELNGAIAAEQNYWIDLESVARDDDRFDLDKVTRVLELAAPFVRQP